MLTYKLNDCLSNDQVAALVGTYLDRRSYDLRVQDAAVGFKPDGSVLFTLVKDAIPQALCNTVYPHLWSVGGQSPASTNRRTAFGPKSGGPNSREAAIGYLDRDRTGERFPYCRATSFTANEVERFDAVKPYIKAVDGVFKQYQPARWEAQIQRVRLTKADWVITDTSFTSVAVNRGMRTKAHFDEGDLPEGMGVITALGNWRGGELIFPKFRVAVAFEPGDVLLCDVHELHANAPIAGERVSSVFFYRRRMVECGTPAEEKQHANRVWGKVR